MPNVHIVQCWRSCMCTCCSSQCSICTSCRHKPYQAGRLRCSSSPWAPRSRTLVRNIERSFDVGLSSLTVRILHFEKIIDGLPLAPLVFHSLLQKNSAQCLARTTATWSNKNNEQMKYNMKVKELRTSLASPQHDHKCSIVAITATSSQHLGQLPGVFGKS